MSLLRLTSSSSVNKAATKFQYRSVGVFICECLDFGNDHPQRSLYSGPPKLTHLLEASMSQPLPQQNRTVTVSATPMGLKFFT